MAKYVKRKKKRRFKLDGIVNAIFLTSLMLYFGSAFILRSYNLTINAELINLNDENTEKQKELDTLKFDIQKYNTREYLMNAIATQNANFAFDADRIYFIEEQQ